MNLAMFKETFLSVRDCKIRLRQAGSGESLIYLHGANGVPQVPGFLNQFTDSYDVLVPEHPGFGASDEPSWLNSMDDLAYFYLDLLDQLELKSAHLIGSSLGGWLSLELAIRQPERFKSIILIGSAGISIPEVPTGKIFRWNPEEAAKHTFHHPEFVKFAIANGLDPETAAKNRHTITKLGWNPRLHHPQLHQRLHRLTMPVQIAWGENDQIIPLAYADALKKLIPNSDVVTFPNCGHLPQVEQAEAFTNTAKIFLQSIQSTNS